MISGKDFVFREKLLNVLHPVRYYPIHLMLCEHLFRAENYNQIFFYHKNNSYMSIIPLTTLLFKILSSHRRKNIAFGWYFRN